MDLFLELVIVLKETVWWVKAAYIIYNFTNSYIVL